MSNTDTSLNLFGAKDSDDVAAYLLKIFHASTFVFEIQVFTNDHHKAFALRSLSVSYSSFPSLVDNTVNSNIRFVLLIATDLGKYDITATILNLETKNGLNVDFWNTFLYGVKFFASESSI